MTWEAKGELATRSKEFRTRWVAHDVQAHLRGTKQFHHRVVGDLTSPESTPAT